MKGRVIGDFVLSVFLVGMKGKKQIVQGQHLRSPAVSDSLGSEGSDGRRQQNWTASAINSAVVKADER